MRHERLGDPGEGRHRLHEYPVFLNAPQGSHHRLLHRRHAREGCIPELFLPHLFPQMFHGIEFGTVGWEFHQTHVLRDP